MPPAAGKDESKGSSVSQPPVKCPRCESPNTKFCYYNNYSLTQPRHFCKTCRRYWTKRDPLRNVPVGGGCRKSNKLRPLPRLPADSKDSSASSDAGFKFLHAVDFQLPKLHSSTTTAFHHQFASLSNTSSATPCFNLDPSLMGFAFPLKQGDNIGFHEMAPHNHGNNLATSIESLSSINQDLHWKLQQQRLATLFVADGAQKEASGHKP